MTILPRHTYEVLAPREVQSAGLPWAHTVEIALPPSYPDTDRVYPVLWVTDGSLGFRLVLGIVEALSVVQEVPEFIVVGVGAPREVDILEFTRRRVREFYSRPRWVNAGPGGQAMTAVIPPDLLDAGGGADAFLSFLVDELRPMLGGDGLRLDAGRGLRFDANEHALFGVSAGGHFVGYSMLSRPEAFAKYIAGSPAFSGAEDALFELEETYAADHDDLPV